VVLQPLVAHLHGAGVVAALHQRPGQLHEDAGARIGREDLLVLLDDGGGHAPTALARPGGAAGGSARARGAQVWEEVVDGPTDPRQSWRMTSPRQPAPLPQETITAAVDWAITSRRSLRAFLPTPVPREVIEQILAVASRAPSGTNIQPWKAHVLTGEAKARLSREILAAHADPDVAATHREEWDYYPREWTSPYVDRRRKVGMDLYGLLGIPKGDRARMHAQFGRNYAFFDAPVGLVFVIDRLMQQGSYLDYGMFLQSIMVAARARGLDTCPQAAFMQYHRIIGAELGLAPTEQVVCGMSLGHADPAAPENALETAREPVAAFATFHEG